MNEITESGLTMKILVDLLQSTGTKGGIESYVRALYSEFGSLKTGHEFIGITPREAPEASAWDWFPGEVIQTKHSGENRVRWAYGELFGISKLANTLRADLIHAPAMLGPSKSSIPVVLTVHDLSYFTHPHLMRNKLLTPGVKLMEKLAAKNAKEIIGISKSTSNLIPRYLNVPSEKVTTVLSSGAPVKPCPSSPMERGNPPQFIAMGQRSPYKSLETAVRAIALMPADKRPNLIITGSHGGDPLLPLVESLDLQSRVTLKGWVGETKLRELMCSSSALIETTVAAGFGMPAVEALTMGIPVISADIPVFREILSDAAIYFAPGDATDLAKTLQRVLEHPRELEEVKQKSPEVASRYSWTRTALETLAVFEKAML